MKTNLREVRRRAKDEDASNKSMDARRNSYLLKNVARLTRSCVVAVSPASSQSFDSFAQTQTRMINDDKNLKSAELFNERLAQAIFWCSSRADISNPKDCLRTPELRPRIFEESRFSAVETVAIERERYGGIEIRKARVPKDLSGGRLLVYFPDVNLFCGASEDETNGFFDVDNVPAWDTWIAYFEDGRSNDCYANYLISWIPPQFVELVSKGIYVNPEECIVWLSDSTVRFGQKLRREGLLA